VDEPITTRDRLGALTPVRYPQVLPVPGRMWTAQEWDRIRRGFRTRHPRGRWNAVVEHDRLFLFRHGTGVGIYEAQFSPIGDGWSITELIMCGDPAVHRRDTDEAHALHVEALIDSQLLDAWDSAAIRRIRALEPARP
jgi:hypothetical protein